MSVLFAGENFMVAVSALPHTVLDVAEIRVIRQPKKPAQFAIMNFLHFTIQSEARLVVYLVRVSING